jgi:hypothetical protein
VRWRGPGREADVEARVLEGRAEPICCAPARDGGAKPTAEGRGEAAVAAAACRGVGAEPGTVFRPTECRPPGAPDRRRGGMDRL